MSRWPFSLIRLLLVEFGFGVTAALTFVDEPIRVVLGTFILARVLVIIDTILVIVDTCLFQPVLLPHRLCQPGFSSPSFRAVSGTVVSGQGEDRPRTLLRLSAHLQLADLVL
jgi:hypothetical protein